MVYLVGAGPGDPGLMTVSGREALRRADVVLYDSLIDPVILCETKPDALLIDVGKRAGRHTRSQEETIELLVKYGGEGRDVVRIKGGDPFLFGRGGEEAERLAEESIPFTIIPGVTALTGATAYAGIPVTHRDYASSLGVATGHGARGKSVDPVRWRELASAVDTIVVFMGIGGMERIVGELREGGLDPATPAAVVQEGTLPSQRVVTATLGTIAETARNEGVEPPALLITGPSVACADTIGWYRPGPLAGIRIGITRQLRQSSSFAETLRSLGAHPVLMPSIETVTTIDTAEVEQAVGNIAGYDAVVFSSTNGVESFIQALKEYGFDARALGGAKLACIGPVTADALAAHGLNADIVAERYVAEGLAESLFDGMEIRGATVLLVRSNLGRDTVKEALEGAGAAVTEATFYETRRADIRPHVANMVRDGGIGMVTFTSSSTVDNFFAQIGAAELPGDILLASIGPQTSKAIRSHGREPVIEAAEYTTAGLAHAITDYFTRNGG